MAKWTRVWLGKEKNASNCIVTANIAPHLVLGNFINGILNHSHVTSFRYIFANIFYRFDRMASVYSPEYTEVQVQGNNEKRKRIENPHSMKWTTLMLVSGLY